MPSLKYKYVLFLLTCLLIGESCKKIPLAKEDKKGMLFFDRDDICKPKAGFAGLYEESLVLDKVTKRFEYSYKYYNKISMLSLTDEGLFYMESDTLNLIHGEPRGNYFEESYNDELAAGEYVIRVKEFSKGRRVPAGNSGFGININDTTLVTVFKGLKMLEGIEAIETIQITTGWILYQSKEYKVTAPNNEFVFSVFDGEVFDKVTYLWKKDTLIPIGTEGIAGKCKMILETQ